MPFASGPILRYVGGGQYVTVGATTYVGAKDLIVVPSDFPTDLASIPRVFWWLLPPNGTYEKSAVIHDWHCTQLAKGDCRISSADADGLFRRMAAEGGTSFVTRWILWTGVRWGALFNPARRPGFLPDAPKVAAITTATALAAAAVIVTVDRAAHWLARLPRTLRRTP